MEKVSIIMPTYNRARYIEAAIQSVTAQTWPNWELIIIDDGSDDETEKIVSFFNDTRINFYKAGRIGIGGVIKNIGLSKTSGSLIAFIDSDDLWHPAKLEQQVKALQRYPDAYFSLTGGYNFRNKDEPVDFFYKQKTGELYGNLFEAIFRAEIAVFVQAFLCRKECLEKVANFPEIKSFSDIDFITEIAWHFKGVVLFQELFFRRLHQSNYISSNWEKSYEEGIELIKLNRFNQRLSQGAASRCLFRTYMNFGEACLRNQLKRKAIRYFMTGWKHRPLSIIPIKKVMKTFFVY